MAINKVEFYDKTLIDLTNLTADSQHMLEGQLGINKYGQKVTGKIPVINPNRIYETCLANLPTIRFPYGYYGYASGYGSAGEQSFKIPLSSSPELTMTRLDTNHVRVNVNLEEGYTSAGSTTTQIFDLRSLMPADWEVDALSVAYPVGSVYCSAENVNPSETFGGEWELTDKEFKPQSLSGEALFTINTTNVSTLAGAYCVIAGHSISVRITITNKVAFTDSTLAVGTLNLAKIGVSRLTLPVYGAAASDGLNGVSYFTVNYNTGALTHADLIGSDSTSTGQNVNYTFTQSILAEHMLDEFCNKFYWKRTA